MPLDIWIYGSGFGESILLMWDVTTENAGKKKHAAFIDCYGGPDYESHPALCQWHDAGYPHVALAAITHPHLDHIQHGSVMMSAAGCFADTVLWWGGPELQRVRAFYAKMREDMEIKEQEMGMTAEMTWEFLNDVDALGKGHHRCRPDGPRAEVKTALGIDLVYSAQSADGPIQFYAISPWLGPQTAYTRWIDSQIYKTRDGRTEVRPNKGVANCTSLGFLIQHGDAQVLLGGDMEADNWTEFHYALQKGSNTGTFPSLNPCLIKVSHHGSSTGEITGMWNPRSGYFGSLEGSEGQPQHCVITPWRLGDSRWHLPDPEIVERIARAGCHVWETASKLNAGAIDLITRPAKSFIHFAVDPKRNQANMIEERFCRCTAP